MERKQPQRKFYFTYGTGHWPGGGWTEVFARDQHEAEELFCRKHPRDEHGFIVCSCVYDEETFKLTKMYKHGNFGKRCVEVINMEVKR